MDEDAMDGDLVRGLRSRSIDVITAADAGMIKRPEPISPWQHRKAAPSIHSMSVITIRSTRIGPQQAWSTGESFWHHRSAIQLESRFGA